jgi:hypothetical protein
MGHQQSLGPVDQLARFQSPTRGLDIGGQPAHLGVARDGHLDRRDDRGPARRLGQVGQRPGVAGPGDLLRRGIGGQHDDRRDAQRRDLGQGQQVGRTGGDPGDHHIRSTIADEADRVGGLGRVADHLESVLGQDAGDTASGQLVALAHHGSPDFPSLLRRQPWGQGRPARPLDAHGLSPSLAPRRDPMNWTDCGPTAEASRSC